MRFPKIFALLLLQPLTVQAYEYEFFEHASVSARASTLGVGGEISIPLVTAADKRQLGVRVGAAGFQYGSSTEKDQTQYNTSVRLLSAYTFLDWYPWGGSFRLTSGIVLNGNQVDIEARPSANGYNFGGVPYSTAQVDKVDGKITFNTLSPYAGIGWDWRTRGSSGWSLSADLGVMYHGAPTATLSANCGPLVLPATCDDIRRDVEQEEQDLNEALKSLKWYPVAAVNGTYRF